MTTKEGKEKVKLSDDDQRRMKILQEEILNNIKEMNKIISYNLAITNSNKIFFMGIPDDGTAAGASAAGGAAAAAAASGGNGGNGGCVYRIGEGGCYDFCGGVCYPC